MSVFENSCNFIGNLTRDPESRLVGDTTVTRFSLAVNRYMGKDKPRETDFFDFEAWERTAENIALRGKKGLLLMVNSSARVDKWVDKEGNKHQKIIFRVNEAKFVNLKSPTDKSEDKVEQAVVNETPF